MKPALVVRGMHGLGDNIHERAIIRQLMKRSEVWLETPWPCVFYDLVAQGLHVVSKPTSLRTQAKNALREKRKFSKVRPPAAAETMLVNYPPDTVRRCGSVLAAMTHVCGCDYQNADFRLPIPEAWDMRADALVKQWRPQKPLLIYRPLSERTEWTGCAARNPLHVPYAQLVQAIRSQYFVVSVADLSEPAREWRVGVDIKADVECHAGELEFETLAALTRRAALVYTAPGFLVILAQAVETPTVAVFGGYENASSFRGGSRFAPYLGIEPIHPCNCFSHHHPCKKTINVEDATDRLKRFSHEASSRYASKPRRPADQLERPHAPVYEPRRA